MGGRIEQADRVQSVRLALTRTPSNEYKFNVVVFWLKFQANKRLLELSITLKLIILC